MTAPASASSSIGWHPFRRVDAYILGQLFTSFILCLMLFSVLLFFSDTLLDFLKEVQRFALPVSILLKQVVLYFPFATALAIPLATFIAVLLTYNQLNNQFELIALRINGLSLWRISRPALLLGCLSAILAYAVSNHVVPWAQFQSQRLKLEAVTGSSLPQNQSSLSFVTYNEEEQVSQLLYVDQSLESELREVTFIDLSQDKTLQVVQARTGYLFSDRWELKNANVYEIFKEDKTLGFSHVGSLAKKNLFYNTDKLEQLQDKLDDYKTLSFNRLKKRLLEDEKTGVVIPAKQYVRFWERLTLPLSCIPLALVAVPFAITRPRVGAERGFIFGTLILFSFYILRSVLVSFGQAWIEPLKDTVPPMTVLGVVSALPLLLMLGLAIHLIRRKSVTL